jgi:hypothetical protein
MAQCHEISTSLTKTIGNMQHSQQAFSMTSYLKSCHQIHVLYMSEEKWLYLAAQVQVYSSQLMTVENP